MRKSVLAFLAASLMVAGAPWAGAEEAAAPEENKMAVDAAVQKETTRKTIAKLRGRLLYKKNQARKMERAVEAADEDSRTRIADLRKQIADIYVAANPKIADNYAEQQDIESRIEALGK